MSTCVGQIVAIFFYSPWDAMTSRSRSKTSRLKSASPPGHSSWPHHITGRGREERWSLPSTVALLCYRQCLLLPPPPPPLSAFQNSLIRSAAAAAAAAAKTPAKCGGEGKKNDSASFPPRLLSSHAHCRYHFLIIDEQRGCNQS